jgi:uncharacterized membrane protein HdeD (DUF308 family)
MSLYGLARNWWWIVLRGLFASVFVLVASFGTYDTLVALVLLFGVYSVVDGLIVLVAGVTHSHGSRPGWLLLLEGLLGIGAGTLAFVSPGLTAIGLLYLLAGWAIVTGALEITAAIPLRGEFAKARLLAFGTVLAGALAAMLFIWPAPISFALLWLTAAYTLIFGLLQIGLGLRVRNWRTRWMRPLRLQPVAIGVGPISADLASVNAAGRAHIDSDRALSRTLE